MTTPIPTGSSIPTAFTDNEGNALPSRTLDVTGPSNYVGTVTTAADGTFRLVNLPVGDYTVTDAVTGASGVVPVVLSTQNAILATSIVVVVNGTTATTARPPGAYSVLWTGPTRPTTGWVQGRDLFLPDLLAGFDGASTPAYNNFREYVNGQWQPRGAEFPNLPRIWMARNAGTPDPPEDNTYFKAGLDILLKSNV